MKIILYHLIKGFSCLYSKDAKSLLSMICPDDKTARINIYRRLQKNSTKYNFQHLETYPVILILDEVIRKELTLVVNSLSMMKTTIGGSRKIYKVKASVTFANFIFFKTYKCFFKF